MSRALPTPRIQEQFQNPALQVDFNRELAGVVGLTEGDAATSIQATPVGQHADRADLLARSRATASPIRSRCRRRNTRIDTLGDLNNLPITAAHSTQLLGGLADVRRPSRSAPSSRTTTSRNTVNIYATAQGRDLGGVAADVQKIVDETARTRCRRARPSRSAARSCTMANAYQQLLIGLGFSIVLIYLLIVVNFQSWLDPFVIIMALPAALAGIVWMLFLTQTHISVPALTGAIMCMGVATANSILVDQLRPRAARATARTPSTRRWRPGATRLRPVIMTALAMIIGMAPMAIEPGQNAPLGPRRHRRPAVCHLRDAVLRARRLQHRARTRAHATAERTPSLPGALPSHVRS